MSLACNKWWLLSVVLSSGELWSSFQKSRILSAELYDGRDQTDAVLIKTCTCELWVGTNLGIRGQVLMKHF